MQITAFKCDKTGRLFEDEAAYKAHLAELRKEDRAQERAAQARQELTALMEQLKLARTLTEVLSLVTQVCEKRDEINHRKSFKGLRWTQMGIVGKDANSVSGRVLFCVGKDANSIFGLSLESVGGFRVQSGSGVAVPPDAPEGTKKCTQYQVTLELAELPGLADTRNAILAARVAESAHDAALKVQADELLFEDSALYREYQEHLAQLDQEIDSLNLRLREYQSQRSQVQHKMATALTEKHTALLALNNEPALTRQALEAQLKVGVV